MSVIKSLEHASMRCGRKLILEVGLFFSPVDRDPPHIDFFLFGSGSIRRISSQRLSTSALESFTGHGKTYARPSTYPSLSPC
jgi:hypothetical protein